MQDFFEQQYHYCRHFHQVFLAPLGLVGLIGRLVSGMIPPQRMENPGWGIYVGPNTYLANPDHRMQTWPPYADSTNVLGPKYRHLETCRDTFQVISIHVRQNPVEPICWFFGCCKKNAMSFMWVWTWGWSQEPRKAWNSAMFIVQVGKVFCVIWWILNDPGETHIVFVAWKQQGNWDTQMMKVFPLESLFLEVSLGPIRAPPSKSSC